MRKLLIGVGAVIVLLVAAVLIGPSLVDWNKYKGQIEKQVAELAGRQLVIGGDISIAVLPAPAVIANDITFSNDPRSEAPNMVELGSLEVRVALGPLFGGEVQVSKIVLIDPIVQLESYADGSNNWTLPVSESASDTQAATSTTNDGGDGGAGGSALGGITLDNFAIERGLVTFKDGVGGNLHVIEDINATLVAATLQGPFEARGDLVVKGIPMGIEVGVDGVFQGRTVPVTAAVSLAGETSLGVSGNIINLFENPRFSGGIQLKSGSPALAAQALGVSLPPAADQAISMSGQVEGDQQTVSVSDLSLAFGGIETTGGLEASFGDVPRVDISLAANHLDLDSLLETLAPNDDASASSSGESAETSADASQPSSAPSDPGSFELPRDVAASIDLSIESIAYRQEKAGPVRLSAELANGEVTLSQLTGALPGSTDVAVFGFLTAENGAPNFEGEVEATIGDTRGLARWLDVDLSQVPGDRLRRIEASATLRGNAENLQAAGVRLAFDRTTLTGGVTLARRDRLSFGAALSVDTIDLDPYLAGLSAHDAGSESESDAAGDGGAASQSAAVGATGDNPLAALSVLKGFDANIKAQAGEVIYQGTPLRDITVDATVYQGALTMRDVSVRDAAGASVGLSGAINDLDGVPVFDGVSVSFVANSITGVTKLAGVELPVSSKAIGAVNLRATANGSALGPKVNGQLSAAGANIAFNGDVSVVPVRPLYAGTLQLAHPDTAALLRAFDVAYRPAGPIGGFNLAMNTSVTADVITLQGLSGRINETTVRGDTTVRLNGARPDIKATLALGSFNADPFLPAAEEGSGSSSSSGSNAANDNSPGYADGEAPWPREPLDLSAMGSADAVIDLMARELSYGAIALSDAVIKATISNSQLTIEQLAGNAFGGTIGITGFLDGQSTPSANGMINFDNGSISNLLSAVIGEPAAVGTVALQTNFDTRGGSVFDMVSALNGQGGFSMKGVDVSGSTQGSAMTGILGLLRGFGQIGSGLTGNKLEDLADVTGQFTVTNGVADLSPLNINSGLGSGVAGGKVDLAGWNVDLAGNVDITGNILTALLGAKIGTPGKLPFSVKGALDAPNISMDTSGLSAGGGGLPIPGLDKVPAIGNLLQGVLGGGSTSQQQQQPQQQAPSSTDEPSPQPQPQQQQQIIQPQDLIKNIFKF